MRGPPDDEDAAGEDYPETSAPRRSEETEGETRILQDLHDNILKGNLNEKIEKRLFETQKEYFTVYMEKLMQKIPMGEDLVKIVRSSGKENEFEYTFTAAKSIVQSQMRVKQIRAFHAVFDMVYGLTWRYVHEKVVSSALKNVLSEEQLKMAYDRYQGCSRTEEEGSVLEMQCLLYCIQEVLDNQEPVKIPNPLYSRFTQQVKAVSEYVISILVSLSKPADAVAPENVPGKEPEEDRARDPEETKKRKLGKTAYVPKAKKTTGGDGNRAKSDVFFWTDEEERDGEQ